MTPLQMVALQLLTYAAGSSCRPHFRLPRPSLGQKWQQVMGRQTKLNQQVIEEFSQLVGAGVPEATAGRALGVSHTTIHNWKKKGELGQQPYRAFVDSITRARSRAAVTAIAQIRQAARDDWRAAAWWLGHSPSTRNDWSDAGFERKVEKRVVAEVVALLEQQITDPGERQRILLAMVAAGLAAETTGEDINEPA